MIKVGIIDGAPWHNIGESLTMKKTRSKTSFYQKFKCRSKFLKSSLIQCFPNLLEHSDIKNIIYPPVSKVSSIFNWNKKSAYPRLWCQIICLSVCLLWTLTPIISGLAKQNGLNYINREHSYGRYSLPKQDSIDWCRVKSVIRSPLYPQATTAGLENTLF